MSELVSECPIRLQDVPMGEDRTDAWAYLRSGGDVYESEGMWFLTGAEVVRFAARHTELFSSSIISQAASCPKTALYMPNSVDGERHARYRRILDRYFAPRVLNEMEDDLRARVNVLIDGFIDRGECEIQRDLAEIFPTEVFSLMFGLPLDDRVKLVGLAHTTMARGQDDSQAAAADAAGQELADYLRDFLVAKRKSPGNDVMSWLISDGDLTDEEIVGMSYNVVQAGLDTVSSEIGFMMHRLATNPGLRRTVLADPETLPAFIEEMVRLEAVAPLMPRITTQDVHIGGKDIPANSVVFIGFAVANRDPRVFTGPDEIDLSQGRRAHFGFGGGEHRCMGSHLARRELKVTFEEFHRRIPEYELAPEARPRVPWPALVPCLDAVPLVFPPGGRA